VVIRVNDTPAVDIVLNVDEIKNADEARAVVNQLVGEIGEDTGVADTAEIQRDAAIKAQNDKYGPVITKYRTRAADKQATLIKVVEVWAGQLYKERTTTIVVDNGEVSYNRGSEKLEFGSGGEKAFIQRARKLRLYRRLVNVKVTESPNRDALKKDRKILKKFPGVRFVRQPRWEITPGRTKGAAITVPAAPPSTD
jgi:hypothetical protein